MYMRTETFAKIFFLISFIGLFMYCILAFYSFHIAYSAVRDIENYNSPGLPKPVSLRMPSYTHKDLLKYILVWTTPDFNENPLGVGKEPFLKNNCSYTNCYITTNKKRYFDAILLDIGVLRRSLWKKTLPHERSPNQIYVFHSMKSAEEAPICNVKADSYFNWTWSYKLDSDIFTPFIEVKDITGKIIAPKRHVKWIEDTRELSILDIQKLKTKKKAVAWIPESCQPRTDRLTFVKQLRAALKEHSLVLDIFGCHMGKLYACPEEGCMKVLERDYYFYLAYEASFSEDYVTTEVLKAYHHNTVPIIMGGANYKYFLPEGSYIDAGVGTPESLATLIDYSIKNPPVYHSFHQWKYHYSISEVHHNKGVCDLCEMINNKVRVASPSIYEKLRKWWFKKLDRKCYPKGAEEIKDIISYMNDSKVHKQWKFMKSARRNQY